VPFALPATITLAIQLFDGSISLRTSVDSKTDERGLVV
jgi:hypothetical protein